MTKCTPEQCNLGHFCTYWCFNGNGKGCPCENAHPMEGEEDENKKPFYDWGLKRLIKKFPKKLPIGDIKIVPVDKSLDK